MEGEIVMPSLGAFARELRDRRGWTQPKAADRAKVGVSTLRKLEQNSGAEFREDTLENLANVLCATGDERAHWWALAGRTGRALPGSGPEDVALLVAALDSAPAAWVRDWRVRIANDAHRRLFPGLADAESLPRWMFGDPRAKLVLPEWWDEARMLVGMMRHLAVSGRGHGHTVDVIRAMSDYPDFRRIWDTGVVHIARPGRLRRIWSPATESETTLREALYPTSESGVIIVGFPAGADEVRSGGQAVEPVAQDRVGELGVGEGR
ncbi:XRE family transcriptional regulator [Nocardia yunnanensis]|uniref:XRE family transcriptional regulator n=1 Tax=Nocardia yunnanensis TaxID=2382165 RepID=A0A386ZJ25_9NOCA|nr:helix-turn-helix domain-containing protein [Nocardia yunnanensis]AYF77144.1 XRE family transcriptional regulator [Nocardia yunnanensis]